MTKNEKNLLIGAGIVVGLLLLFGGGLGASKPGGGGPPGGVRAFEITCTGTTCIIGAGEQVSYEDACARAIASGNPLVRLDPRRGPQDRVIALKACLMAAGIQIEEVA